MDIDMMRIKNFIKNATPILAGFFVLAATFAGGAYYGARQAPAVGKVAQILHLETPAAIHEQVDFEPFWQAWSVIEDKYVSNDGMDRQKMVYGAIEGMAKSLGDPYTVFFPPVEKEMFESSVRGDFEGVGMEIGLRKGILTVISPLKGTPSYRAGIRAGDKILKIADKITNDMTTEEAVRLIRGPKGTEIALTVLGADTEKPHEVKITRDRIEIPNIETEKKDGGIFVIKLFSFNEGSASGFKNALREFVNSGSNKLILDLRGNPGGYLEVAVDMASWWLPMGEVIVKEKFSNGTENAYRSRGYNALGTLPTVILVNEGSASASEILAGALQDYKLATLVGGKTFGKGSVQEMVPITSDTSLKITIARWLTPNGNSISEKGLTPDVDVKFTEADAAKGHDPQMERAIEILKAK
ncbi:MAG: S41 family peptidase [Candidatus Niyogibacteria bacterium]|nr:S41 family peptidase [Candidatus Niyogibacteria bacterium]